jgi:oxygen-independent coproporphyrinogen-3 oxidase
MKQVQNFAHLDWTAKHKVGTIFFGGGTPTVLPVSMLNNLLQTSLGSFAISRTGLEISLEVNPATVNQDDLSRLFRAGFNRLSIGVQSFADEDLRALGRPHTAAEARDAFVMARKAGFTNISLDLMYGLPGQSVSAWRETLCTALELEPDHLSIYELTVEEQTVFGDLQEQGKLVLPREDVVLRMMKVALEETGKKSFHRYEISNYARPGKECRHNINYWENGSYIGIGAGAVSCLSGRRFSAIADVEKYCHKIETGESPFGEMEELDLEARFRESVVMGLRMTRGVSIAGLYSRFGLNAREYYGGTLERLQNEGLLAVEGDFFRLTARGLKLANTVMAELV